jgi:hypothetical protein
MKSSPWINPVLSSCWEEHRPEPVNDMGNPQQAWQNRNILSQGEEFPDLEASVYQEILDPPAAAMPAEDL